jgi:hypothetical protein
MVGIPATSTLSLTHVGTPEKYPGRGFSASALALLGPSDRGLDHLGDRDLSRVQRLHQPDRVVAPEGVVSEGVDPVVAHG